MAAVDGAVPPCAFRVRVDALELQQYGVPEVLAAALRAGRTVSRHQLDAWPAYLYEVAAPHRWAAPPEELT